MERTCEIGELAKAVGITVRALRHCDHIGLLKPCDRTESGHRLYSQMDLATSLRAQMAIVRDRIS